jgi:threonyl-tRNA synthetase
MSEDQLVSTTKQSKVVKYKVEADVVNLRQQGLSYQDIADELNSSGKVPADDPLDKWVVMRFLEKMPEINKQIVQENKQRLVEVVSTNMQIVNEVAGLYGKAKFILETMEQRAADNNSMIDPYRFKAIASEMRELLKQMTEIQREITDAENVRRFMEIVLTTLKEEAPQALPVIAEKLRALKGTQWYADMMGGK